MPRFRRNLIAALRQTLPDERRRLRMREQPRVEIDQHAGVTRMQVDQCREFPEALAPRLPRARCIASEISSPKHDATETGRWRAGSSREDDISREQTRIYPPAELTAG